MSLKRRIGQCIKILLVVCLFVCLGCSDTPKRYSRPGLSFGSKAEGGISNLGTRVIPKPWESWREAEDLSGAELRNPQIVAGDRYFFAGQRKLAREAYQKASKEKLPVNIRESLALRLAAVSLSLDEPQGALRTMSDFFRDAKRDAQGASAEFAVVFGYAYGRSGDAEQGLAWFEKALEVGATGQRNLAAEQGARALIRSVPEEAFEALADKFQTAPEMQRVFGEERSRRSKGILELGNKSEFSRLWVSDDATQPLETAKPLANGEKQAVAALLPLTGKYGALGLSVKNGIELAFDGQAMQDRYNLVVKDSSQGEGSIELKAKDLLTNSAPQVIFGPLLSEDAPVVASVAQRSQVPILTFSKSNNLQTGNGVFRLAPTVDSQISSLLDECSDKLKLRRFAIVAPEEAAGQEFASSLQGMLKARGLELVHQSFYFKDDLDAFMRIAPEIEALDIDAVFFPDNPTVGSRFLGALTPAFREKVKILGSANWDNPVQLDNSRALFNGTIFVSPFVLNGSNPVATQFVDAYNAKYGKKPDFLAAQAFDGATMVFSAMKSQDSGSLEDALRSLDAYDGLTGRISLGLGGEMNRRMSVVLYEEGNFLPVTEQAGPNSFTYRGNTPVSSSETLRLPTGPVNTLVSPQGSHGGNG